MTDLEPDDLPIRALRWAAVALLALSLGACLAKGADTPADPVLVEAGTPSRVPGFDQIAIAIDPAGPADPAQFCVLLADTPTQQAQGLMGRSDLGGYDAMLFRFPSDSTGAFYMRRVPVPLSLAWFDADGQFVGSVDMAPCPDRPGCPTYDPPRPYRLAIEVLQGDLGRLGIGPGARLAEVGACPS